ncbi:TonB-dependent receptor [Hyphomonas sp. NPDC076900]|uniref:TonB-dependent receptor n=1 Tax=unclassified Hyphomonas TaxID=2630699 RepID=UPI003D0720F7
MLKRQKFLATAGALSLAVAAGAGHAWAQDSSLSKAPEGESRQDTIYVTASKRETALQDTPMAVSALAGEGLESQNAISLEDIFRQVPGLMVQEGETGAGRGRVSIRGVRSQGEGTVSLYYDETPIIGSQGTGSDPGGRTGDLALYDLERVEVLRGPQGTLYGASSMGGAIRMIFNDPDSDKFSGRAKGLLSMTEEGGTNYGAAGVVNLPITETFAIRTVGTYSFDEGYIDQVSLGINDQYAKNTNDSESYSLRTKVKYDVTSKLSLSLLGLFQDSQVSDAAFYKTNLERFENDAATQYSYDEQVVLLSGTVDWDLDFATLVSATSWSKSQTERTIDATATIDTSIAFPTTPCRIYYGLTAPAACTPEQTSAYIAYAQSRAPGLFYADMENTVWTQEIRLTSNQEGRLNWTVGGYYENRDDHVDSYVVKATDDRGELIEPLDVTGLRYIQTDFEQYAAFGEVNYRILPWLEALIGLRAYDYTKTISGEVVIPSGPTFQAPSPYTTTKTSESGIVSKFGLSAEVNDDVMFYALASEGFRPGGTNNTPNIPDELIAYDSDSLWTYEAGVKSEWMNGNLVLNAAAYRTEWDNIQVSTRTADNIFAFITNAGAAVIEGAELEATLYPATGLTINGTFNYVSAKLSEDQVNSASLDSTTVGRAGDAIPYVPETSGSLSINYERPLAGAIFSTNVAVAYTGEYATGFRPTSSTYRVIGDYSLVNAHAMLDFGDWNVSFFARNLTNNHKTTFSGGTDIAVAPRPRTVGVSLEKSF